VNERILEKLSILADAAKYDVSCASSGSNRSNTSGGLGSGCAGGICHSFTEDGRCISLLKVLYTNHCIYNCAYCINRKSNDRKRTAFTVQELIDLTIGFYRRNYIEGIFLSSGIFKNPDFTMERLVQVIKLLRTEHRFNGYIHIKAIPGSSDDLIKEAGIYADRLSVNLEVPTKESLALLAPEKNRDDILRPIKLLQSSIIENREAIKLYRKAPLFAPAGQSTQMIVGATKETDMQILYTSSIFYQKMNMKRVYYSGYNPVSDDSRLPAIGTPVPLMRENRLYQADWLLRFYKFDVTEIVNESNSMLDMEIDPKISWALRNRHYFPIDINIADYEIILRVPGIGVQSAQKICAARKFGPLNYENLKRLNVAMNRAKFFITCTDYTGHKDTETIKLRQMIIKEIRSKYKPNFSPQMVLF
jgi:putative DNA modification/repair radical SAM protein